MNWVYLMSLLRTVFVSIGLGELTVSFATLSVRLLLRCLREGGFFKA